MRPRPRYIPSRSVHEHAERWGVETVQNRLTAPQDLAKRPPSRTGQTARETRNTVGSLPGSAACWKPMRETGAAHPPGQGHSLAGSQWYGSATPVGASQWELMTGGRTRGPAPGRSPPRHDPQARSFTRGLLTRHQVGSGEGDRRGSVRAAPVSFCAPSGPRCQTRFISRRACSPWTGRIADRGPSAASKLAG